MNEHNFHADKHLIALEVCHRRLPTVDFWLAMHTILANFPKLLWYLLLLQQSVPVVVGVLPVNLRPAPAHFLTNENIRRVSFSTRTGDKT